MNLLLLLLCSFYYLTLLILRSHYCSSYHLPRRRHSGSSITCRFRTKIATKASTSTNLQSTTAVAVMSSMFVPTTTVNLSTTRSWINGSGHTCPDDKIQKNENNKAAKSKKNKKQSGSGGDEILLTGRSRAGQSTSWFLPKYKTLVDVGCIVDGSVPKTILLTHTHADHVQCLMDIINHKLPPRKRMFQRRVTNRQRGQDQQQQQPQPILKVYLPIEAEPFVRNFIIASQSMYDCGVEDGDDTDDDDDDDDDTENDNDIETNAGPSYCDSSTTSTPTSNDSDLDHIHGLDLDPRIELCPVRPGDVIEFGTSQDRLKIDVLRMTHRIPCVGYSMYRCKRRLKSQYIGLPGREIGQLRKSIGDDIYETFEEPLVCIMGDTTSQVFEDYPAILQQHSYVVVECTFLQSKDRSRAEITKHMLWDDLEPYIVQNPTTMFLLTHFSLRHSTLSIRERFVEIQKMYPNVHPMIVEDEIDQQWSKMMNDDDDVDGNDENMSNKKKKKKDKKKRPTLTTQRTDGVDSSMGDVNNLNTPPRCQCMMCLSSSSSSSSSK